MKKYLIELTLISTIFFIGCYLLSEIKFSDEFIVHKTIDTHYKKVAWNIHMINERKEDINESIIFFGSSITQGGINDSLLTSIGIKSLNMGVPHNGNELSLYFQKRVLENSSPKKIIYLKGKIPYVGLHKLTPLLYSSSSLLEIGQTVNFDFLNFIFKKARLSLEYFFFMLNNKRLLKNQNSKFQSNGFGQVNSYNQIDEDIYQNTINSNIDEALNLYMNDYLFENEKNRNRVINDLKRLKRKLTEKYFQNNFLFNQKNQERFLSNAINLSKRKSIGFEKVYIPILIDCKINGDYNRNYYKPSNSDTVKLIKSDKCNFLLKNEYWEDKNHLNQAGADIFTKTMAPLIQPTYNEY